MLLAQALAADGVLLVVLDEKCLGVFLPVGAHLPVGGQLDAALIRRFAHVAYAPQAGKPGGVHAPGHPVGAFQDAGFAHAVHQQRRAGVHQNGVAHLVIPKVIVGEAAQAGLHPADEDGHVAVRLTDAVAIDNGGAVGAQTCPAAGGVGVVVAALFGHGVVVDHAVNHPGRHQKAQPGLAKAGEGRRVLPGRKAQHGHAIARMLQHAADDGMPEGRVIHIRVAAHIHKIRRVPAARCGFLGRDRQKLLIHGAPPLHALYCRR